MSISPLTLIKSLLETKKSYILARDLKWAVEKSFRHVRAIDRRVASLSPNNNPRGFALLSYILDAFFLKQGQPIPITHTNFWASLQIAKTLVEMGYHVDVIDYRNQTFIPEKDYSIVIDVRNNLERMTPHLSKQCIRVMHLDTANILFHNAAEANRLLALQQRRGVTLPPRRFEVPNVGIENADCAITYGGEFAIKTFLYSNKPIYRVPCPVDLTCLKSEDKDFESVRKSFLWFGSGGMIHKGLDLVLESFAEMPEYHLTVCGPVKKEPDFEKVFYKELYNTPNITTIGWIDVNSTQFMEITNKCVGVVSASCSEGAGTATIICMGVGLIPVFTVEACAAASDNIGFVLKDHKIDTIKQAVQEVANLPATTLHQISHEVSDYVRANHTREKFAYEYKMVLQEIISTYQK